MDRVIHHGEYDETDEENYGWIQWFCSLEDHQFLIEVDENYIRNSHNISDLKHKFDNYYESLRMILSEDSPDSEDIENQQFVELNKSAINLYGLIHSRYILTEQGLQIMYDKYINGIFGTCPRLKCNKQQVLPIGISNELNKGRVKIYCPRCHDIYQLNKSLNIDGSYFGTEFPMKFLKYFPDLEIKEDVKLYIPKIYGFKIFGQKGSKYEIKYDEFGKPINKEKIDIILNSVRTDAYD